MGGVRFWAVVGAGVLAAAPSWGQGAATIPPGNDGSLGTVPRTENPQVDGGGTRPVPDKGVITPPATGAGPVIRPPVTGSMPIIPPPGSAGGAPGVVPK